MTDDDLWIGDLVQLKKSGRRGTYEGMTKKGQARVAIDEVVILTNFSNLKISNAQTPSKKVTLTTEKITTEINSTFENQIDLHMEALPKEYKNYLPQRILDKQIEICRTYIQHAIDLKKYQITIIHGKGVGQLRKEVEHILGDFKEVKSTELVNNGGATLVSFAY